MDTDIGSDIDDAVALAYLLRQPRCELVGVTTVSGDVQKRAALVEAVCLAAGRKDVSIHCGRREPLFGGPGQPKVPQYKAIEGLGLRLDREENSAVEFMRKTIRSRPHEINLLSIGPFSNLALLFALDPEIPFLLRSLVSMAGHFFVEDGREWNCVCDPTATSIVYNSPRHSHISIGLDVTLQCTMNSPEVKSRFKGEPLSTVSSMADTWFETEPTLTFHDPLSAAYLFNPSLVKLRQGLVRTEPHDPGRPFFVEDEGPDHVAESTDPAAFFEEFFSVF